MVNTSPAWALRTFAGVAGLRVEAEVEGSGPRWNAHAGKDGGRAVALVDVAIHGHGAGDFVIALHAADGDGHVMNHAEAFAMVGKGVMESAADVECDSILQCIVRRED